MSSSLAMTSEYQSYAGLIENNTTDIDKLGTSWVQHRYVDKWKLTESGSYKPIQTTIYDQRAYGTYSYTSSYLYVSSSTETLQRFTTASVFSLAPSTKQTFFMDTYSSGSLSFIITAITLTAPMVLNILDNAANIQGTATITTAMVPGNVTISAGGFPDSQFDLENFSGAGTLTFRVVINETFNLTSSSLVPYGVTASLGNKFQGTGYENARLNGSKLVGSAINANSTQTIDGGPVVKVTKVNPNQVVFAGNQLTTIDRATSGRSKSQLNVQNIRSL